MSAGAKTGHCPKFADEYPVVVPTEITLKVA